MKRFDEVEYFSDVARIRHTIVAVLKKYGFVDEILLQSDPGEPLSESREGKIAPTGAFGLEFYNGTPLFIYTPFGKVRIDSASHVECRFVFAHKIFKELNDLFGLVEVEPLRTDRNEFGPKFVITKLPWRPQEKLPTKYQTEKRRKLLTKAFLRADAKHIYDVYTQVNQRFIDNQQPEYVIECKEPKDRVSLPTWGREE